MKSVKWKDYSIISTGDGEKLERWGDVILLRPDPQVIWRAKKPLRSFKNINAIYSRSSEGGGAWQTIKPFKDEWQIEWEGLKFIVKPMGFKHTGLFPEQAVNWKKMMELIKKANREIKVLNLFAYTGGASVAAAKAGAKVTHVDASKGMVERAKQNASLNGINSIRYIQDDCKKFLEREIRRGNTYDAIIMDPPSYGRGPNGEMWKIEDSLYDFVELAKKVLSTSPLFVLINSYTTGLQPGVIANILKLIFGKNNVFSDEIGIESEEEIVLPCGASGWKIF